MQEKATASSEKFSVLSSVLFHCLLRSSPLMLVSQRDLRGITMATPKTTIADAFEKLQRSLSEEHRHSFESTELEHVWSEVRDIQTAQRKRQSAQNLRRIEPLLQGLEKYAKVIEVLCNGTPYLSFIWVSVF
jgi:hypothetical protein